MKRTYLVSAEEMKQYDRYTTEKLGIPSAVLMERAALATVCALKERVKNLPQKRILVVCGGGNNGGDGLAIARLLLDKGCRTDVFLCTLEEKCSEETKRQLQILKAYGQKLLPIFPKEEYDILIDAIFGVGLSRELSQTYADWVEQMNHSRAYKVSVDIPSGIEADSGRCMGCAIQADLTVTYAFLKRGLYCEPGRRYAGEVVCADIGITERSFAGKMPACFTYEQKKDFPENPFLERSSDGNKGTFGKLLVLAGSKDMSGACLLCAEGAYRSGAGMVKVITLEDNRRIVQTAFPEAMLLTYTDGELPTEEVKKAFAWADGIVAGPGMGTGEAAASLLKLVLKEADCSLILDADALNLLAKQEELQILAKERKQRFPKRELVLTPHQGELARLTGQKIEELKENPLLHQQALAEQFHCTLVSKDAVTLVCTKEEQQFYLNSAGNSGMATAGSGDVLAGILGSFLVQSEKKGNISILESMAAGVYLHALAGDRAKERVGEAAMIAGDIIDSLKELSKESVGF